MQTAKRLAGIQEYYFSGKLREIDALNKAGRQVINLGIGSPDLPPHPAVIKVLQEESLKPHVHAYQNYKGVPAFREAVSDWYKKWYAVDLDAATEILPLMGSKEGIMHVCMTYLDDESLVLIPDPGYPTYRSAAALTGAAILDYELQPANSWFPDLDAIAASIAEYRTRKALRNILMFVNYPHMPTGQLPTKEMFALLVSFAKQQDILLVHDNPYSFILNDRPLSLLSVPGAMDVAIELNSLSKSHNMAGWRVGMLCGAAERINDVLKFKSNMDSGMFLPIQLAAAAALQLGDDWHKELNAAYHQRRLRVHALLDMLNCRYDKARAGMFVWAAIPENIQDGYALADHILYNANVFITPGGIFGAQGNRYVRISLCCTEEKIMAATERIGNI